ncbi:MAG: bifunctional folylpolyglutamate synthase/dihydrofolate synthase [Spirochaetales bacterium]|nr:bifunctional folylpolyglutamate synthase/dihydrofolate synthase [Spirochaetales bacterium]
MERFTTLDEAFVYIEHLTNFERKPPKEVREYRLDRMKTLLEVFDNPHLKIPAVHIAGTKGKGSTAHLIAGACIQGGLKTGLYTSPHVLSYKERFTVNRQQMSDEYVLELINNVLSRIERVKLTFYESPTTFEVLTVMAFLMFEAEGCDCNVIETGIGGRLDATNLLDPLCSVIMPVAMEHTNILGETIEDIAFEKAGIIKAGKTVFIGRQTDAAMQVLLKRALDLQSPVCLMKDCYHDQGDADFSLVFPDGSAGSFTQSPHLPGRIQKENAAVAVMASEYVIGKLKPFTSFAQRSVWIQDGIGSVSINGRFERYRFHSTVIVLDGAHTPESIEHVAETFARIYGTGGICLFGMVEGKNIPGVCPSLRGGFSKVIVSRPGTFKKSDVNQIYAIVQEALGPSMVELIPEGDEALDRALSLNPSAVCVTGSFYLAAVIAKICRERGYEHVE